jgi:hypothetical protein
VLQNYLVTLFELLEKYREAEEDAEAVIQKLDEMEFEIERAILDTQVRNIAYNFKLAVLNRKLIAASCLSRNKRPRCEELMRL